MACLYTQLPSRCSLSLYFLSVNISTLGASRGGCFYFIWVGDTSEMSF